MPLVIVRRRTRAHLILTPTPQRRYNTASRKKLAAASAESARVETLQDGSITQVQGCRTRLQVALRVGEGIVGKVVQ